MAPVRRLPGDPPPQYGPNDDLFSVEIHHSGFFCGQGSNKTYVDQRIDTFDDCEVDTWSLLWIEDFVRQCGYKDVTRLEVYWLLPRKNLFDGLRKIECDADTNHMMSVVSKIKTFELYVHDKDLERSIFNDNDIPMTGGPELAKVLTPTKRRPLDIPPFYDKVISPKQRVELQRKFDRREADAWNSNAAHQFTSERRSTRSRAQFQQEDEEDSGGSEDSSSGSDFVDSDYEVDRDDDNLYDKYVDADEEEEQGKDKDKDAARSKEKGNASKGKNLVEEEEELNLPDSDEEGGDSSLKFKSFRPEDMENPLFKVGMVFSSVKEVRQALAEYAVKNRVAIKTPKNDRIRVKAHCAPSCPWEFFASKDSRSKCIMIKKYKDEHTCSREWEVKQFTASYIAKKYTEKVRTDEGMSLRNIGRVVQEDYNMAASKSKLARAKREAIRKIRGDEQKQYNMLWDFVEELRTANPGSTFYLTLKNGSLFDKLYMSLDACKRGFLHGCRPLICLDGCHLKTKHGGILLTAIGVDPNDCIFPIVIAVVEVENTITWTWFLKTLKEDLGIHNTSPWTLMSDRQKGLINAVENMFPDSEHRICIRHLYQNFHASWKGEILKNQLWAIARSNNLTTWRQNMDKMKEMNPEAWAYLDAVPPNTWCRAFFQEFPKCDLLLNNSCEVFNKYILDARDLPILSMLRRIKGQMMTRWYTKRNECENDWSQLQICPKIKKKLDKNTKWAKSCHEHPTSKGVFKVNSKENEYVVDVLKNTCSCRRWQLTGIPCSHSIACLRFERIKPEDKVAACYSIEAYRLAYGHVIMPCRDPAEWEKTNGPPVEPPKYEKKAGRKKKKRIIHPSEKDEGTRFSKHGVKMHCSVCNSTKHNRRKCTVLHPSKIVPALDKLPVKRNLLEAPSAQDSQCIELNITQIPDEISSQTYSVISTLLQEVEASQATVDAPPGPLSECSFIAMSRDELPVPRATTNAQLLKKKMQTRKRKKTTTPAAARQALVPPRAATQASQAAHVQADATVVGVSEAAKLARRTKAKKVPKD